MQCAYCRQVKQSYFKKPMAIDLAKLHFFTNLIRELSPFRKILEFTVNAQIKYTVFKDLFLGAQKAKSERYLAKIPVKFTGRQVLLRVCRYTFVFEALESKLVSFCDYLSS